MTYSITDYQNGMTWSYQEVVFPTRGGQLDLSSTLYERMPPRTRSPCLGKQRLDGE